MPLSGPHPRLDAAAVASLVDTAVRELGLPVWTVAPATLSLTVHEDAESGPRVLFVVNPTPESEKATVTLHRPAGLTDLLDESRLDGRENQVDLVVPARSVRILRIDLA